MTTQIEQDTERLYDILAQLEAQVGGKRTLNEFPTGIAPALNGVYFFFEPGEFRANGVDLRVVRVGTHTGRTSTLGKRLFEHKINGGRSVFREHVNASLLHRAGIRHDDPKHWHAACISDYIGKMLFLWARVENRGQRRRIE